MIQDKDELIETIEKWVEELKAEASEEKKGELEVYEQYLTLVKKCDFSRKQNIENIAYKKHDLINDLSRIYWRLECAHPLDFYAIHAVRNCLGLTNDKWIKFNSREDREKDKKARDERKAEYERMAKETGDSCYGCPNRFECLRGNGTCRWYGKQGDWVYRDDY